MLLKKQQNKCAAINRLNFKLLKHLQSASKGPTTLKIFNSNNSAVKEATFGIIRKNVSTHTIPTIRRFV